MWVRYRTKWAHGPSAWEYDFTLDDACDFEDYRDGKVYEQEQNWHWSDKYRGIDVELVDSPPPEEVDREIKYARSIISGWVKKLEALEKFK